MKNYEIYCVTINNDICIEVQANKFRVNEKFISFEYECRDVCTIPKKIVSRIEIGTNTVWSPEQEVNNEKTV